jgi:hypothetical protein
MVLEVLPTGLIVQGNQLKVDPGSIMYLAQSDVYKFNGAIITRNSHPITTPTV